MVLVVDDDKLIRWSLSEIFSPEGYQVDTVASVDEAVRLAREKVYHLIFSDVEICNQSGLEMLARIKEFQPKAKIIILSAYPKSKIEPQLKNLKVFAILEKPFQAESIRDKAREAIHLPPNKIGDVKERS